MRPMFTIFRTMIVFLCFCFACLPAKATEHPDWTTPLPPFQIADNLYYVGSRDLAAYLITTPAGNILINANLESSPPLIRASVEKLGFSWKDTKILLNGQAHSDHMGGAAEVLRETHAKDMVMDGDADVVRSGGRTDFAFGTDGIETYPPARVDRVLHDGDNVVLGGVTLTAHLTGGHTRGCTAWTFRSHIAGDPAGRFRNVVIVGGWRPLSQYRLLATSGHPASYPGIKEDFYRTFTTLRGLPCDIFLGAHGIYFDLLPKVNRMQTEGEAAFIDPKGYIDAVNDAKTDFDETVATQTALVAAQTPLSQQITQIAKDAKGTVYVACSLPATKLDCGLNEHGHPPMQSTFKFPLAFAVLHQVELGKLQLDQPVRFLKSDRYKTSSPLQDEFPNADVDIPVRRLLKVMAEESDNIAGDLLLRIIGGPDALQQYLDSLGLSAIHQQDSEHTLHGDQKLQYRDCAEPVAMVSLLRLLADNSPLSPEHTTLLNTWMLEASSGPQRIKGLLPAGTPVAHKTGSSGKEFGIIPATNDVGLITLPDGRRLAVAIFVTDAHADQDTCEAVIARIAHAIYADAVTKAR